MIHRGVIIPSRDSRPYTLPVEEPALHAHLGM